MRFEKDLDRNVAVVRERLGADKSFDVLERRFRVGGRRAVMFFVDGLVKGREMQEVIRRLMAVERAQLAPKPVEKLVNDVLPWMELEVVEEVEQGVREVLAGPLLLLVDGCDRGIVLDLREYPVRAVGEPDLEKVTRGSRDGLVETIVFNTALIRRRLRDPRLRFEMLRMGTNAHTDVAVGYLEGECDPSLVAKVKKAIEECDLPAVTMGARSVSEALFHRGFNPLPRVRLSERPDVIAAHLLEGHVVILVDTTPQGIILPSNLWHFTQHVEEFFQAPLIGTYLRWIRLVGIAMSLLLGPLWLALALAPEGQLPPWLDVVGPKEKPVIPLWIQFFMLEGGLDLLRMALIHTPNAFATALGIVGAILLGDLAVQVGLFVPETILYIALVAIGYFATPSIEFALALRLFRYLLLATVSLFGLLGLAAGLVLVFLIMASTQSFGLPYLWPLIPFDGPALMRLLIRYPVPRVSQFASRQAHRKRGGAPSPQPSGSS